jgi:hypothetical protein
MTAKALSIPWLAAVALVAGCGGGAEPKSVPDLRGQRLDVAERRLEAAGLDFERVGGGTLGIVVRSNWSVCDQDPKPGRKASKVTLIVDRDCPPPPLAIVPDLTGRTLEKAEDILIERGIGYDVELIAEEESGPPLIVCEQSASGVSASEVTLYVAGDCDPPEPVPPLVPELSGLALDEAKRLLDRRGIEYVVEPLDDKPVVDALWEVCFQEPFAKERARFVTIFAEDDCD